MFKGGKSMILFIDPWLILNLKKSIDSSISSLFFLYNIIQIFIIFFNFSNHVIHGQSFNHGTVAGQQAYVVIFLKSFLHLG